MSVLQTNYMVTLLTTHYQCKRESDLQREESSKEIIRSFECNVSKTNILFIDASGSYTGGFNW